MTIKTLVSKEFVANEEDVARLSDVVKISQWKYSYFEDPETGKLYRPGADFTVKGEDLEDMFVEV